MIIGIDASRANREQKTGIEWYSYYLIQELKKISLKPGDKFILYSPSRLRGKLADLPNGWQNKVLSWPLKYIWTQIRLCLEILINPPDVLFVPAHILPFFCSVKSVITIHDLGFERFPEHYSFWQRIYYSWAHKQSAKKAKKIIVPSKFTKRELSELYRIKEDRITVISEGYDKKVFHLMQDRVKIKSVLGKYKIKRPYFLYVGRLEKKKNIKGLVKAYSEFYTSNSRLKDIPQLVLVGKTGFGYQEIEPMIYDLGPKVCRLGYIQSDKDLACLYNGAEAFIFPCFYEGFGLPILEAMACGCPVLVSNGTSIAEVGGEAVLYFSPNDTEAMARAMEKITNSREFREELVKRGLERTAKDFSWEKCAQETMKTLTGL